MTTTYFTAITIGPIGHAFSQVTKPAALWAASSLFSTVSRRLCEAISNLEGFSAADIVAPFYPRKDCCEMAGELPEGAYYELFLERKDGIGLFHDHIIVRDANQQILEKFSGICEKVLASVAKDYGISEQSLREFLMIRACSFEKSEAENAILKCAKMLDCLELPGKFVAEEQENLILGAFTNENVKKIGLRMGVAVDEWQLIHPKDRRNRKANPSVRDLPDIASVGMPAGYKKSNYYCLLRSDGDSMSEIFSNLTEDKDCRDFSRICLSYCSDVAQLVDQYGGVTIYSGGDDLFAIVPCEGTSDTGERGTVFSLMKQITGLFNSHFEVYQNQIRLQNEENKQKGLNEVKKIPSLSFGAVICHKKYPLYEAVDRSYQLLVEVAKKFPDPATGEKAKNAAAVQLIKHSGQSETIVVSCPKLSKVAEMAEKIIDEKVGATLSDEETVLLSAAQKLMMFETLVNVSGERHVDHLFHNIFDSDFHQTGVQNFLHEELPSFYKECCLTHQVRLCEDDEIKNSPAKALGQMLRMIKFFTEKE